MQFVGLFALLGLFGAASAQFPPAPANTSYTWFCEYQVGDGDTATYPNSCYDKQCPQEPPADPTWKVYAWQPFNNLTICQIFQEGKPICEIEDHQCPEAANFQLVYTRLEDFHRAYHIRDFNAITHFFNNDTKILQPDDSKFTDKPTFIAGLPSMVLQYPEIVAKPRQVLTVHLTNVTSVIHSIGDWGPSETIKSLNSPFYARWSTNEHHHWTMDTILLALSGNLSFAPSTAKAMQEAPSALFKEIAARDTLFGKMWAKKDYDGILEEFYAETAAVCNHDREPEDSGRGPLVYRKNIVKYMKTNPFAEKAEFTPSIVTLGFNDTTVAHEIGTANKGTQNFYTRWVLQGKGKAAKWMVETHVFAFVHQKDGNLKAQTTDTIVI